MESIFPKTDGEQYFTIQFFSEVLALFSFTGISNFRSEEQILKKVLIEILREERKPKDRDMYDVICESISKLAIIESTFRAFLDEEYYQAGKVINSCFSQRFLEAARHGLSPSWKRTSW